MPIFDLSTVRKDADTANQGDSLNADELQESNTGQVSSEKTNRGKLLDEGERKTIEIDGPLSAIYAQALNVAFAKESMADGSFTQLMTANDINEEGVDPSLYVYASDEDTLNKEGVGQHFDKLRVALDKYSEKKKVLVVENANASNRRMAIEALEDYVIAHKTRVIYRRSVAVESIVALIKAL